MDRRSTALGLLTGMLVAAGTIGGGAAVWAASAKPAQSDEVIQACAGDHGVLRLAIPNCRAHESLISWNVEGPQGPAGPQGPQGPQGPPGLPGGSSQPQFASLPVVEHEIAESMRFGLTSDPAFVPGLRVVLSTPGTYLISGNVRGALMQSASHDCSLVAQLVQGSPRVAIPTTQRTIVNDVATPGTEMNATAPIEAVLTTTVPNTVVRVSAFTVNSMGFACAGVGRIISDTHGATTLHAQRIS